MDTAGVHVGHTVDLDDYVKENPADFTLLKRASLQDLKLENVIETITYYNKIDYREELWKKNCFQYWKKFVMMK